MTTQSDILTGAAPALAPGFTDPVHDGQRCFRALMQAMARPGTLQPFDCGGLVPPHPLSASLAAAVLTLADYDTPVWLDPSLASSQAVKTYLQFHTGAPLAVSPLDAAFSIIGNAQNLPALSSFNQGTQDYPDRSTTVIMAVETLHGSADVSLSGPGIKTSQDFCASPLSPQFWEQLAANNAQFPLGVDVIFAGPGGFAAIPRSSRLARKEA